MPRIANKCPATKKTLSHKFSFSVVLKKKTAEKKDVQQIFSPVSAETKKLSFFLSDFLLGFGNGRLERLMRFTGLRGHHPPDKPKPNYPLFEVRTKSIHQNKKTKPQKMVAKKHVQKKNTKYPHILLLKKQHPFFNSQNTCITSHGNPSLHVSSVKT